jgi:hypothetical protein
MRSITAPSTIRTTLIGVVVLAMLAIMLVIVPVTPASATGDMVWSCDGPNWWRSYRGFSKAGSGTWAYTEEQNDDCGTVGVQESYRLYPGGPTYWSDWDFDGFRAEIFPGNI